MRPLEHRAAPPVTLGRAAPAAAPGWTVRPTAVAGVLVTTAVLDLWGYQLGRLLRGPSMPRAVGVLQGWSRRAWRWLGLEVEVHGAPPPGGVVYVANHRSYLDIPVVAGALGTAFMSRADVSSWPIVGGAARAVGCVFVDRGDLRARARAARALVRRIAAGSVAVFPEGTTGGERLPGAFHAGLFRLLHRLGAAVVPLTLRYGERRAYWTEDVGLGVHLRTRVLVPGPLRVALHVGRALDPRAFVHGAALRAAAHAAVVAPIEELGELA